MIISDIYQKFLASSGVTTDSRNTPLHSLFFALKGDNFDGNEYAVAALRAGCSYAFVDDEKRLDVSEPRIIYVEDCLHTLQKLAHYHRVQLKTKIIGITGTNGKTTTKELITAVLRKRYKVLATQGNLNNHIGVPLTLLQLKAEHEIAVVEMGANHPGEIAQLVDICEPDYGIITNVGKAHLEGFGSLEGVIKTKGALFDYLRTKSDSCIFLNADNEYLVPIAHDLFAFKYSQHPGCYLQGSVTGHSIYLSLTWQHRGGEAHHIQTQLVGDYNLDNVLAAITIGCVYDVDSALIDEAIAGYVPQNNRSQLMKTDKNTLVVDAYNANPTSMAASIANFKKVKASHKVVILGDMRELGADSQSEHQKIVELLKDDTFEQVYLVGDQFAATQHPFSTFADVTTLLKRLEKQPLEGKTILIKGSNGTKLFKLPEHL